MHLLQDGQDRAVFAFRMRNYISKSVDDDDLWTKQPPVDVPGAQTTTVNFCFDSVLEQQKLFY